MEEVKFKDRVPTYPGRVRLVHVSGDLYDLVRADQPTDPGTALNKVAFDSIIQSRLTGRYYPMTVEKRVNSKQSYTVNPIPTSGWTLDSTQKKAQSGSYTVEVNSLYSSYTPDKALDGSMDTQYRSDADGEITFKISFPAAIKVTKYKLAMRASNYTYDVKTEFQGSTDGVNWKTLLTTYEKPDDLTEFTVDSPGEYTAYRLKFTASETGIYLYQFQISAYEVTTYYNAYTIAEGVPAAWTDGQRITVQTPSNADNFAVSGNTLNDVPIFSILSRGSQYELWYSGGLFWVKGG